MTSLSMTKMHGANLGYITLQGPDNASTGSNLTFSIAVRLSDFNLLSVPDRSHFSCILSIECVLFSYYFYFVFRVKSWFFFDARFISKLLTSIALSCRGRRFVLLVFGELFKQ